MSIRTRAAGLGLLLALLQAPAALGGQGVDAPKLAAVKTLKCQFDKMAIGTWLKDGQTEVKIQPVKIALGFEQINTEDGTAEVTGSFGAPYIVVRVAGTYLHFIQVGGQGFLYTTTVFDRFARPGKLMAVHARHEFTEVSLPGYTSRPEQYYGECEVVP